MDDFAQCFYLIDIFVFPCSEQSQLNKESLRDWFVWDDVSVNDIE